MFHFLFPFTFIILTNSKSILSWNATTAATQKTTPMETTTVWKTTTEFSPPTTITIGYKKEKTTTTTIENNKSYEFQSNFSRNNDSVFVSLYSNASDAFVSINNTFIAGKYEEDPCEILFTEHSIDFKMIKETRILINFNGSFTRDLATQIGDRLNDIADLLLTVRSMDNRNNTVVTD